MNQKYFNFLTLNSCSNKLCLFGTSVGSFKQIRILRAASRFRSVLRYQLQYFRQRHEPFRRAARSAESTVPLWATKEILKSFASLGAPRSATSGALRTNEVCLIVKNIFFTQKTLKSEPECVAFQFPVPPQRDERALKILNPEEILISNYVCFGAPKGEDSISKSFTREEQRNILLKRSY